MPTRAQRIGTTAEKQVMTWVAGAGIVATKPDEDRHGWDLFLELPQQGSGSGPTCFVQVKATDGKRGGCAVRLDNWQRHIQSPWPCFFVVLEYAGRVEPQRLYVIHVGEAWIARVLERLRVLQARGEAVGPRHSLRLTWGPDEMVDDRSGAGILGAIQQAAGPDPVAYVIEKRRLLETVGYGSDRYEGTITFSGSSDVDLYQLLADHAIGLTPLVEARSVTINERRFGIALPTDLPGHSLPMKISMNPAPDEVRVRFQNDNGSRVVQEVCRMYRSAASFPFLPPQYHKARIVSDIVTLIMGRGTRRRNLTVSLPRIDQDVPIGTAYRAAQLLRMVMEQPERGLRIDFLTPTGSITSDASEMGISDSDASLAPRLDAIENCWRVMQAHGLPDSELIQLRDVYEKAEPLAQMALCLDQPRGEANFWGTLDSRPEIAEGTIAVVLAAGLALGRYKLAAILVVQGRAQIVGDPANKTGWRFEITNGDLEVREKIAEPARAALVPRLQRSIARVGKELNGPPIDIVVLMPVPEGVALDA